MVIYTIGHGSASIYTIIALLRQYEVEVLVDVRSSPYSKYVPQFNREMLQPILDREGLTYLFAGDYLGGRPRDPSCYKNGQIPDGHADFLHLVDYPTVMTRDWYREGIDHLLEIAETSRVAVMCSEENPARCHRQHLISQTLLARGAEVQHIRLSGTLQKAWLQADENEDLESDPARQMSLFSVPGAEEAAETEPELSYEPVEPDRPLRSTDFLHAQTPAQKKSAARKKARASSETLDERMRATEELLKKWRENNKPD